MPKSPNQSTTTQQTSQFGMNMADDALVTFGAPVGPGQLSFHDAGYMDVTQLTLGNNPLHLPANMNNLFIQYSGDGVQQFSSTGAPVSADYNTLTYKLIAYTGSATFGHAADGTATVTGTTSQVVLAQGSLLSGELNFNPDGSIAGEVDASMFMAGQRVGNLDISVQHAATDITPTATGGLMLDNGNLHATFVPLKVA